MSVITSREILKLENDISELKIQIEKLIKLLSK
jgi:hypothetical protein